MTYVWASLILLGMLGGQLLNILSLPGNWVVVGLAALWRWLHPELMTWNFIFLLLGLAVAGEVVEWVSQSWGAKKYGATGAGNWGGIIGTFAGSILMAPLFMGLGALVGALLGAWLGCLLFEIVFRRRKGAEALTAAKGAFYGRSLGMTMKLALGMTMFVMCASRVWP